MNKAARKQAVQPLAVHPREPLPPTISLDESVETAAARRSHIEVDQDAQRKAAIGKIVELKDAAEERRRQKEQHERKIKPSRLNQQRRTKEAEIDRCHEPGQHRDDG